MDSHSLSKEKPIPPPPKRFQYHALFSYVAEDEAYVSAVHAALRPEVKVFNYKNEGIWGGKLAKKLEHLYKNEAQFCVVFMSQAYLASPWTTKELKIVKLVDEQKPGYMLPVLLDGTIVPEIEGIAWLDKTLTAGQVAARLEATIQAPPPKPWWFYVSTEVRVAVAAAVLALILFARPAVNYFRPSRTTIQSVTANAQEITARLVNSGPKSSTVVGQRLKFGALPIEDAVLRLDKSASATIAPGGRDLKLKALTLLTKCDADGIRPNNEVVAALLDQQPVTLEVDIRESDDPPGKTTRRIVTIPAARLEPLVRKLVPNNVDDC